MKKVFVFMALAALVFVSCGKDDPKKEHGGKTGGYEAPIKIDGDFSDWAALPADKVVVTENSELSAYQDLKKMKLYYDQYYLYAYIEFNFAAYGNKVGAADGVWFATSMFCFNSDNDTSTGGYPGQWEQGDTPCIDGFAEYTIVDGNPDDGTVGSLVAEPEFGFYNWSGAPNGNTWSWEAAEGDVSKFAKAYCTDKAIEIAFLRALYPGGKMEDTITVGVNFQINGWDATGALPNKGEVTETNPTGRPNLLQISVVK
ncbi:MAG: hypothetical protein K6A64_02640 [Bacteroidales bacterium]|nr:hypothetical protein [Bacteroidales bacterium]